MPLLIHIGSRKTGSKAIQRFLTLNHNNQRGNFYLPQAGRQGGWFQPLYNALIEGNDALLSILQAEISRHPDKLTIISYEGLSKLPEHAVDKLASFFPHANVLYFVRPQYAFINSLLNQQIKAHRKSITEIEKFTSNLIDQEPDLDIEKIYNRWSTCFGDKQVHCALYSRRHDSIDTFVNIAGSTYFDNTQRNNTANNTALNEAGITTFYNLKSVLEPGDPMQKVIDTLHRQGTELFSQKTDTELYIIDHATVQALIECYRDTNSRLFERLGFVDETAHFFHAEKLLYSDSFHFPTQPPLLPHMLPCFKLLRTLLLDS